MRLAGTHIILRDKGRDSDDEDLFHWLNLEEWAYYDQPDKPFTGISREEFNERLKENRRRAREPSTNSHGWHIDTTEGQHIGWINYYHLDEQAKRVYLGICLPDEETWGKGHGTEAVCLLIDHLFEMMELQEIRIATWTGNKRMVRCAEKSGFTAVAKMPHRAAFSTRGEPLERIEFSISREDWLA
jgi:RimJ/RimL family protein N-acetyltransferase